MRDLLSEYGTTILAVFVGMLALGMGWEFISKIVDINVWSLSSLI